MFAAVHLPQFRLQAALRHEPELWTKPIALVDPERTIPVVCDLTEPASRAGVQEGLTPTQALARCSSLSIRHRSASHESATTEALLQCVYSFSPHLETTAPGLCTLDLRGLAVLTGAGRPELLAWARQLRSALARLNLRAHLGIGAVPNVTGQAALWTKAIEIVSDPDAFMASLPVLALGPSTDVGDILQKWGIRTVGQMLSLGQQALTDRLGLEALALFAAASTNTSRPLQLTRPTDRFEESFEFEQPVEMIQPLIFILRRFVDQLSQRLEFAGLVAERQILQIRLESGETFQRQLRLPEPTRQPELLFRTLQTHLETLRTDAPITAVTLMLTPAEPRLKQFGLFEAVLRDPQQFQETLARLEALLGPGRVGAPVLENSHRPDAFRVAPPDFENAPVPKPGSDLAMFRTTPLRRFRPEMAAQIRTRARTADSHGRESPSAVRCSIVQGSVQLAIGPWRASGQWWEPGAWQREEWDTQLEGGPVLRVSRRPEGWFVEGLLD